MNKEKFKVDVLYGPRPYARPEWLGKMVVDTPSKRQMRWYEFKEALYYASMFAAMFTCFSIAIISLSMIGG